MTQQTSGHAQPGAPADPSTTQVARDEAARVGRTGADEAKHVASTAAEQVGQVTGEARRQAGDMLAQAREQLAEQTRAGQHRATEGLRSLAAEIHQMADGGDQHGPASDLAKQAAERIDAVAGWLDRHEPGDLVEEVRRFARRRPGAFLTGAALAGVLAGRLTRGAVDAGRSGSAETTTPGMEPVGTAPVAPVPSPRPAGTPPPPPPGGPAGTGPAHAVPPGGSFTPPPPPPGPAPGPAPGTVPPASPGGAGGYGGPPPTDPGGGPAHALRSEASTVGEYVEELERGSTAPHAGGPYGGTAAGEQEPGGRR